MLAVSLLMLAYFYSVWPDFQVYRWAVRTWLDGGDVINARAPISNPDPLPWVYPPFALAVLAPLGLLPFTAGIALIHVTGHFSSSGGICCRISRIGSSTNPSGPKAIALTCGVDAAGSATSMPGGAPGCVRR